MPLDKTIETLEGLDESLHDNYVKQDDGTYVLAALKDMVPKDKVEDVGGLKSALEKERAAAREASKKFKALQESTAGIDKDKYNELVAKEAEHAEAEAERKGEWDKLKAQMLEKHKEELAAKDKEIARLTGNLEKHLVDAEVVNAISKADGNVELLRPHVKAMVKLVQSESGEFAPQVVDATGSLRVNGSGDPLTIKDLVSEMRDQDVYAGAFKGSGQSGSDSQPQAGGEGNIAANGGGNPTIPKDGINRSQMDTKQKVAYIKEHGNEAFQNLPL
jgi:hypothetical protein